MRARLVAFTTLLALCAAGARADEPPGSLTLREAYALALKSSEQVGIAGANVETAEANHVSAALTYYGPTVSASATGFIQNEVIGTTNVIAGTEYPGRLASLYSSTNRVNAVIPLVRAQVFAARRATRLGIAGAEEQLRRAKQDLMFTVASLFIGTLQARQRLVIAEAAIERAKGQVQSVTAKVKAGGALKTAELLAQIDLQRALTQRNTAVRDLRTVESQFQRYVGAAPPAALVLPPTPSVDAPDDPALRHDSRPDLRAQRLLVEQNEATLSQYRVRLFVPTLDAIPFLNLGINQGPYAAPGSGATPPARFDIFTYGAAWTFTIPLLQSGNEWLDIRRQKVTIRASRLQASFLTRQIDNEVREALVRLQTARQAIEIAAEQQRVAGQNYQMVSSHYKLGAATLLELITAQAAVFEAETNRTIANNDRELATYEVLYAQGKIDL